MTTSRNRLIKSLTNLLGAVMKETSMLKLKELWMVGFQKKKEMGIFLRWNFKLKLIQKKMNLKRILRQLKKKKQLPIQPHLSTQILMTLNLMIPNCLTPSLWFIEHARNNGVLKC